MLFIKALTPFLLASAAIAAPIAKRDLVSDIGTISSDLSSLSTAVSGFTGNLFQALALLTDFNNIKSAIDTATTAATASAALDTADSTTLTASITALVPTILSVVTEVEAKLSVATSAGYDSEILSALNTLRNHSSNLFTAVIAILDAADAATVTTYSTEVFNALTTAIADY